MGQHTPRIVAPFRDLEFKRHPPFSRRPEMVRPRLELLARHAAVLFVDLIDCHFERSREISYYLGMSRDYDFWIYIITNRNDSVLYIGVTNSLSRRTWEHREGIGAGFPSDYRCKKLIYFEHYRIFATHRARKTAQEVVALEENRVDQSSESELARSWQRRLARHIVVRDLSTLLRDARNDRSPVLPNSR